jgi:flagellar motor switch protein FliM
LPASAGPANPGDGSAAADPAEAGAQDIVQPYDFRSPTLLSAREARKLRQHQEEFASAFAARLSLFLRLDVTARLLGLQTLFYQKFVRSWVNPSHLTLFKTEPLRGVSVMEIPPGLGSAMVDRLMGGPGLPADPIPPFSEIELALLEQAAQLILVEWCGLWRDLRELKPVILGHESNGRFAQAAPPETLMLVVQVEVRLGGCAERVQLGFPYLALEPMIRQACQGVDAAAEAAEPPVAKSAPRWNSCFDDVRVPVRMEWEGLEMSARDVLALKIGDVVPIDPRNAGEVRVCVADLPRFTGRPGTLAGKWAVELTRVIQD